MTDEIKPTVRSYTVYKAGQMVGRGTFINEELLRKDYPESTFTLVLDEYHEPPRREHTYAEMRRMAYPPLSEFADATYWASQGDNSKMEAYLAAVEAVKARYPKPSNR